MENSTSSKSILKVPANTKVLEFQTSSIWIKDGIMYSVPKPGAPVEQSIEEMKSEMSKLRELLGGKKICMILESNANSKPTKKEHRDFIASELDSVTKAMAIITVSPLSRMIANLFFGLKPPPYPVKMCSNESDAKEWIKQYL